MTDLHVPKFLQEGETQYFSEVKAVLWFVERMMVDNATFHVSFCRWAAYSTFQKWWRYCGLRAERFSTMQHSMFGSPNDIHPCFCRHVPHSASQKWWHCCGFRNEQVWTMQHSTFKKWMRFTQIYPGVCRPGPHSTSKKWRQCCVLRKAGFGKHNGIQHNGIQAGFCRCSPHSASHKWSQC